MFIACSDLHITETKPVYRVEENWMAVCLSKLKQIIDLANEKKCPVIVAGDFFDKSSHSMELLISTMNLLKTCKQQIIVIPGNHDPKAHNMELLNKSAISLMNFVGTNVFNKVISIKSGNFKIDFFPFGSELKSMGGDIAVIHEFAYVEKPWADVSESGNYRKIIRRLGGDYKLIIAGDNHEDFIEEYRGCTFLNCGAMLRTDRNEQDRVPKFYLIEDNLNIIPQPFSIKKDVFDVKVLDIIKRKDEAIEKVADQMKSNMKIDLDFKRNMERRLQQKDLDNETEVKEMIRSVIK